jgi:uncharacterized protein
LELINTPEFQWRWYSDTVTNFLVGIISDTHGLLRPEAVSALRGCDLILHAGDIGKAEVLEDLRKLAPVHAVRGNVDRGDLAAGLQDTAVVDAAGKLFYLIHNIAELDLDPAAAGFAAVVSGHSHKPEVRAHAGVMYINPGSAGPRRFRLPVCIARAEVSSEVRVQIIQLVP